MQDFIINLTRKKLLIGGIILTNVFISVNPAQAEHLIDAITSIDGVTYQVDLDDCSEYYSAERWRHVIFWVTTKGDSSKYRAIASCSPYQLKVEAYGWDWFNSGGGYRVGTVGGNIARVACNY